MARTDYLVVGLGNPGSRYSNTPHNVGFEVVDHLVKRWSVDLKKDFDGLYGSFDLTSLIRVHLLKPQTFMNLSGNSVGPAAHFYKIPTERVLVLVDDIDIPQGMLRIRKTGSAGGHNGLKSIIEGLGSEDFPRLRIGVGRSAADAKAHVLSKWEAAARKLYGENIVPHAADAVVWFLENGVEAAMNKFNGQVPEGEKS